MEVVEELVEREIHLRAAAGKVRTETYEGREHLVVPVIACMEGVIHAVNAPEPEFVPSQTLTSSVSGWNGRYAVLGHPTKDGRQISANNPKVLEAHRFGTIFDAKMKDSRLCMEAWIDPVRLEALGAHDLLARIRKGEQIEVSIGGHVRTEQRSGEHKGKKYKTAWRELSADHLAFLPKTRGACSIEMGCGALRAAEGPPEYEVYEAVEGGLLTLSGDESLDARQRRIYDAIQRTFDTNIPVPVNQAYPREIYDDHVIVESHGKLYSIDYTLTDAGVKFASERYEVRQMPTTYVRVDEKRGLEGVFEEIRALVGKRHSAGDQKMLQTVHDHAVSLGAECVPVKAAAAQQDCDHCDGLGQDGKKDCAYCDGTGKMKLKAASEWFKGLVEGVKGFFKKEPRIAWFDKPDEIKALQVSEVLERDVTPLWFADDVKDLTISPTATANVETALAVKEG